MQDIKNIAISTLCLVAGLVSCAGSTAQAENRFVLKPFIGAGISYESNYFLEPVNEREITIYHLRPGLDFGYTTAKSNITLTYVLDGNWYDESGNPPEGELSADDLDFIGHDMEFAADSQVTDRLNLSFEDVFILSRDPDRLDYYSNEIIRNKYSKNILEPRATYRFGEKFNLTGAYRNTIIDYEDDFDEDSTENRAIFDLSYNMSSLNTISLEYQYWEKDYDESLTDYTSHQTTLNFTRELKYYTINAQGGFQHRSFDLPGVEDIDEFVWGLSITAPKPELLVSLSQNLNDTSIASDYYLGTRLHIEIGHLFHEKIHTKFSGYYQYSDYLDHPEGRTDDTFGGYLTVEYLRNDYFTIGLDTGYESRDSSLSINDYDNFYVLAGIRFNYDMGSK